MTGDERDVLAEQFERTRPHLRAVAYRMLGSVSEAEDAVQEAWLRLSRSEAERIDNLSAWLTTVVGRISLDMLRARGSRREEYLGSRLPEPIVAADDNDPEHEAVLADSVGLALLVVIETLTPAERLAFVLHDMFAVSFEEIAPIVGRTTPATRTLASRARRRVQGAAPNPDADLAKQREVVDAFLAPRGRGTSRRSSPCSTLTWSSAWTPGPPESGCRSKAPRRSRGRFSSADADSRRSRGRLWSTAVRVSWSVPGRKPIAVIGFTVVHGRIATIDLIADAEKLRGLDLGGEK